MAAEAAVSTGVAAGVSMAGASPEVAGASPEVAGASAEGASAAAAAFREAEVFAATEVFAVDQRWDTTAWVAVRMAGSAARADSAARAA